MEHVRYYIQHLKELLLLFKGCTKKWRIGNRLPVRWWLPYNQGLNKKRIPKWLCVHNSNGHSL